MARWLLGLLITLPTLVAASPAYADESRRSLAEALFQAAKGLMAEGRYDEACPKLIESQRLEPGGGTLLLLGLCHESQHKYATAQAELRAAESLARRDRRSDREKLAARKLAELEGKVSTVTIHTAEGGAGLVLDGTSLSNDAVGVPLPVDPGAHRLDVSAAGKTTRSVTFDIGDSAERREVSVPALATAPPIVPQRGVAPGPSSSGASARTWIGWGATGVGAAGIVVGSVFGVRALVLNGQAKDLCDPARCSDLEAIDKNDRARTSATIATVGIGVGAALVVTGVVLLLTAPRSKSAALSLASGGVLAF